MATLLQLVKKTFYHNLNYGKSAKCLFKISLRLYDTNLSWKPNVGQLKHKAQSFQDYKFMNDNE